MNTLREAVRNKVLYTLLFFAILIIGAGVVLSALSYVESERILQDFGFAAIRLFSVGDRHLRGRQPDPPRGRAPHGVHDPLEAPLARRVPARASTWASS